MRPIHAIVPLKSGPSAKSRLARALSEPWRAGLARAMAEHVLDVLMTSPVIDAVSVVGGPPEFADWAEMRGAAVIADREDGGTAAACRQGAAALAQDPAGPAILFLNGDLPWLSPQSLESLARAGEDAEVVVAPDQREIGTNALLLAARSSLEPLFGPDSFHRHLSAARESGGRTAVVRDPGLAFDVDEPEDLVRLGVWRGVDWTAVAAEGVLQS